MENEWLRERHEMLDDKAPMDLLLDGSMEDLLLVKEYVEAAAGRQGARNRGGVGVEQGGDGLGVAFGGGRVCNPPVSVPRTRVPRSL